MVLTGTRGTLANLWNMHRTVLRKHKHCCGHSTAAPLIACEGSTRRRSSGTTSVHMNGFTSHLIVPLIAVSDALEKRFSSQRRRTVAIYYLAARHHHVEFIGRARTLGLYLYIYILSPCSIPENQRENPTGIDIYLTERRNLASDATYTRKDEERKRAAAATPRRPLLARRQPLLQR